MKYLKTSNINFPKSEEFDASDLQKVAKKFEQIDALYLFARNYFNQKTLWQSF
ncbi:hypothetical protein ABMX62_19085 [Vibrio vulnificus]|uniref:hypothetical protein n=1 Tax=Vibrio vulnificus TaxID=672 RepID=UPI00405891C3